MRIQLLPIALIFFSVCIFAQSPEEEGSFVDQSLPVLPVTPEAASLGRYGNVPVNLAVGKINHTVPLYTIKVGDFEWPIYLSYDYNGLITEQDHPMTGMGWNLIANGMINRQVRGRPDELSNSNYKATTIAPYIEGAFNHLTGEAYKRKHYEIVSNLAHYNFDGESDKYTIGVPGLGGSFTYDENGGLVYIDYKNYKIEKERNKFRIIDDRGITYYFDKNTWGTHSFGGQGESAQSSVIVGYLLTEIRLPNRKGSIYFDYGEEEPYGKIVFTELKTVITKNGPGQTIINPEVASHSSLTRRKLKKIRFPEGEVIFDITNGTDQAIATQSLNYIIIRNTHKQIARYDFTYSDKTKNRKTLDRITKSNGSIRSPWYDFEYHQFPLNIAAEQNFKYQDYWGYYNSSSRSLLESENKEIKFENTVSGALKKIKYPTKGTTEIRYEQNQILSQTEPSPCDTSNFSSSKGQTVNFREGLSNSIIDEVINVPKNRLVKVSVNLHAGDASENTSYWGLEIYEFNITTDGGGCGEKVNIPIDFSGESISCRNVVDCPKTWSSTQISDRGFTTEGKIRIRGRVSTPTGTSGRLIITYSYNTPQSDYYITNYGGVRVQSTKDCDAYGNCTLKSYKYSSLSLAVNTFRSKYTIYQNRASGNGSWTYTSAKSMFDYLSYQGSPVFYKEVKVIENGNRNGHTINRYSFMGPSGSGFPFVTPPNNNWINGKLKEQEIYGTKGLLQKTVNEYAQYYPYGFGGRSTKRAYGLNAAKYRYRYAIFGTDELLINGDPKDYLENQYTDYPKALQLKKTTITNYKKEGDIIQETNYRYDAPRGQLKTQTVIDSKSGTQETNYYYPYDKRSTVNNKLVAQNRIANPIETKYKINGAQQSNQVTEYKDWGNTIVMPGITKTAKGNTTPEPRLTYHDYDSYGNPLEVSQADGKSIMYVWGYNYTQPIVKIENASYTGIPSDARTILNQLQTASNTENNTAQEEHMRNLIGNIRRHAYFKEAQVTGYTYDPLIGVTSITDPKGETTYYKYDDFNRLAYVLDQDGHVTQQLRYNYEGQGTEALGSVNIIPSVSGTIFARDRITFSAGASSSASIVYSWSVNGVQEQCDASASFVKIFSTEGNYTISVVAYDPQTQLSASSSLQVYVAYPELKRPLVDESHENVLYGTKVTYTASRIGGGSGSYRYEWYMNDVKQSATGKKLEFTGHTTATHHIYFKVIDLITGKTTKSSTQRLEVYDRIGVPSIAINTAAHVLSGTTITFTGSRGTGGPPEGDTEYMWYINDIRQDDNTVLRKLFSTSGTYVVRFRVIDDEITGHYNEKSVTVHVHPNLNTPNLSTQYTHFVKGSTVTFTASNIGGGSGNRRYEWYVNNTRQAYTGTQLRYTFNAKSTYTIKFRVIDNTIPNHTREKSITVYAYDPLRTPNINNNISNRVHIVKGTTVIFTASGIGGGSGARRYEWYLNGVKQSATGTSLTYQHNTKGSYQVKFKVIDTRITSPGYSVEKSLTMYVYNPMTVTSSPGAGVMGNGVWSLRLRANTPKEGSGHFTRSKWTITRKANPYWSSVLNTSASIYTFHSNSNGEFELSADFTDTKTKQTYKLIIPITVNRTTGGGGGGGGDDCPNCGDQW
ncbi:hypothetical protein J8281_11540 [Aquimarina sp. U1-2]|uniref:hypothetical protein n=1 Tax=Aquimarina sp. U1-2 TaxID=2823141 RepID=UPI001AECEF02|nr:hypothetical protein [Aquimarina sp. U1-2]MBP2832819.1 hypothetical protein [Aquimarina sp. U1-2]